MAGTAGTGCVVVLIIVHPHPDFGFPMIPMCRSMFRTVSHTEWPWGNLGSYLSPTRNKKMNKDGSKTGSLHLLLSYFIWDHIVGLCSLLSWSN